MGHACPTLSCPMLYYAPNTQLIQYLSLYMGPDTTFSYFYFRVVDNLFHQLSALEVALKISWHQLSQHKFQARQHIVCSVVV